jgi:hypothetical protein
MNTPELSVAIKASQHLCGRSTGKTSVHGQHRPFAASRNGSSPHLLTGLANGNGNGSGNTSGGMHQGMSGAGTAESLQHAASRDLPPHLRHVPSDQLIYPTAAAQLHVPVPHPHSAVALSAVLPMLAHPSAASVLANGHFAAASGHMVPPHHRAAGGATSVPNGLLATHHVFMREQR